MGQPGGLKADPAHYSMGDFYQIRQEKASVPYLLEAYGEEYRRYLASTKLYFPGLC